MTKDQRLMRLSRIADIKSEIDLAKLQAIVQRRDECLRLMAVLDNCPAVDDPATLTALAAWQNWADQRRQVLARQLDATHAELEKARAMAGLSQARASVIEKLKA